MPFRATWALVWLVLSCASGEAATLIRDNLYGVKALRAAEAWAVGNYGSIYHTANGGKTWESHESGTKTPLFSVDFVDAQHGWAAGKSAEIRATTDGGRTWKLQKTPIPPSKHLFKVHAV